MVAIGSRESVCHFFPQLRAANRFQMWDFFATVLPVWAALDHIPLDVPEESRIRIESTVHSQLISWNPSGGHALKDLHLLVAKLAAGESDSTKKRELAPLSGGTWLLWNLTDNASIQDESIIAATLGRIFVSEFSQYWAINT